jgi:hypothetical protein
MKSKLQVWTNGTVAACGCVSGRIGKKVKTRFKNLMRCGIDKSKAWDGLTPEGILAHLNSWILGRALNTDILRHKPIILFYWTVIVK